MTFGSLFAGIGGLDLGLERAGMECKWQVEINPYCQKVLAKHWPDIRRHGDIRTFPEADPEQFKVDLICGGFPCQDISSAGKKAGINGKRSGLWSEYARIVGILRPRFVLIENVADLRKRGLDRVLGDLSRLGYDAEWDCIPAGAVGAVHLRNRCFVLAHDADRHHVGEVGAFPWNSQEAATDGGLSGESPARLPWEDSPRPGWRGHWADEPAVGRVAHGVSGRVDRLRAVGNSVVPQVAEWIGRQIMRATQ